MLWTIFWVLISFFAIIGVMEFMMCVIELISMRTTRTVKDISLVVRLRGEEKNVEFLLSSLCVMAERIAFKNLTTKVVIYDEGIAEHTYQRICSFAEENPTISLIENKKEM